MYDYVIVGAGPFGCTFARKASEAGRSVLLVDRRGGVGGNCATSVVDGVQVHEYGPHQFHTNSKEVWDFVNGFGEFNGYQARVVADAGAGPLYSFPLNMWTFQQLWGVRTADQAVERIARTVDRDCDQERSRAGAWATSAASSTGSSSRATRGSSGGGTRRRCRPRSSAGSASATRSTTATSTTATRGSRWRATRGSSSG
jgi:choline dehydrogenase-like flavoprotein